MSDLLPHVFHLILGIQELAHSDPHHHGVRGRPRPRRVAQDAELDGQILLVLLHVRVYAARVRIEVGAVAGGKLRRNAVGHGAQTEDALLFVIIHP